MATFEQLQVIGKTIMSCSAQAQLLGMIQVSSYLGMAFEEVVRMARELELEAGAVEVVEPGVRSEEA